MCGGRRQTAPGFGQNRYGYHGCGQSRRAPCGHRAGCGRRRCGHNVGAAPILGAGYATVAPTQHANLPARGGQVSGITRIEPTSQGLRYPVVDNVRAVSGAQSEKEIEAGLDVIEEPPAYTPHASPAIPVSQQPEYQAAPAPVSSKVQHLNDDFAALPILQNRTSAINQDITNLNNALESMRLRECGSRCAAKRAGKQLVRDIWAVEEAKWAGLGKADRKALKRQLKGFKKMVRAEIRAH